MNFFDELRNERHSWWQRKDGARLRAVLDHLPELQTSFSINNGKVCVGKKDDPNAQQWIAAARELIPWKKGPFELCGETIDAEWRSDMKWERLAPHLKKLEGDRKSTRLNSSHVK